MARDKSLCVHCEHWLRYNETRYECGRALSGFDCSFSSKDGYNPPTYEQLEQENHSLKVLISSMLYEINAIWNIEEMNQDVRKHAEQVEKELQGIE